MVDKKKSTIADDFWDKTISSDGDESEESESKAPKKEPKMRFTILLSKDLVERLKDCVYDTRGMTISDLAETAISKEIAEREQQRGAAFPPRQGEIRPGRPMK